MTGNAVTLSDIRGAVDSLGLSNRPVCLHASLRSFGWVEGGARTIVDGFLSRGCTVMVPSFTAGFQVAPPADRRYPRNGCDYERETWPGDSRDDCYSTDSNEIDGDLGVVPATVVRMPGRFRGDHPTDSFSAVGPLAAALIRRQHPMDVYAPFEELLDRGGWVVLIGVDLTRMTLIHLAEQRAGRTLCRRWVRSRSGEIIECQLGTCSSGFERLRPALKPIERTTVVGHSLWRVYPTAQVVELASAAIRQDPEITHCPDPDCIRCRDAILGGPMIGAS